MLASIACGRNSIGIEIDKAFSSFIIEQARTAVATSNQLLSARITDHNRFIVSHMASRGPAKYVNKPHGFPVVTRQETGMELNRVTDVVSSIDLSIEASYEVVGRLDNTAHMDRETNVIRNTGSKQLALDL
jgi:hypothetical protein